MSVDSDTVRRVAKLSRIAVDEASVHELTQRLNDILDWADALQKIDVDGVEPMASVTQMNMKHREDVVREGDDADVILENAPEAAEGFFVVPKVVE